MTVKDLQVYGEYILALAGCDEQHRAILVLKSQNMKSLAFTLESEIAIRHPSGGVTITKNIPILVDGGRFMDLWGREWHVLREKHQPQSSEDLGQH